MLSRIEAKLIKISHSFFYFLVWSGHFIVFSPFFKIKLEGKENIPKKGRYILAANHKNFFDGWLSAYAIGPFKKVSFLIAKRVLRHKGWQILARLMGSVLISNEIEEYQKALKKLNNVLSHNGKVGIFPEGDISNKPIPRKFKGGVAKLSIDSKTKVVPIHISGTYNLRYFNYWLKRAEIVIKIGKPLELYSFADKNGNNLEEVAEILRKEIIELSGLKELNPSDSKVFASSCSTSVKETKAQIR